MITNQYLNAMEVEHIIAVNALNLVAWKFSPLSWTAVHGGDEDGFELQAHNWLNAV